MVWIGYGIALARSKGRLAVPAFLVKSPFGGAACLILAAVVLAGGLASIGHFRGISKGTLQPWAHLSVLFLGLAFVHLQAWGAIGLVTHAVKRETTQSGQASLAKEDTE